jgi:hypothetical protein
MTKRLRVIGLALAGTMLLALPVSHLLWGAPPAGNKQLICHIDETTGTGKVLEISIHAIPAHCAHHPGDYTGSVPAPFPPLVKGDACSPLVAPATRVCK